MPTGASERHGATDESIETLLSVRSSVTSIVEFVNRASQHADAPRMEPWHSRRSSRSHPPDLRLVPSSCLKTSIKATIASLSSRGSPERDLFFRWMQRSAQDVVSQGFLGGEL